MKEYKIVSGEGSWYFKSKADLLTIQGYLEQLRKQQEYNYDELLDKLNSDGLESSEIEFIKILD